MMYHHWLLFIFVKPNGEQNDHDDDDQLLELCIRLCDE